jgi:L-threonylcarbamoyladenylate synthase
MTYNKEIRKAVEILKKGGVIVYPTDTAYALGGVFDDKKVIKRILKIKKRRDTKFTLIASSLSQVKKYFELNKIQLQLAKKYWPGPLSIVVSDRFAVRVPDLEMARRLARGAGKPLIATSANVSGRATPYSVKQVVRQFDSPTPPNPPSRHYGRQVSKGGNGGGPLSKEGRKRKKTLTGDVDLILDVGKLPKQKTSTVVKILKGKIEIVREGGVKIK